MREWTPTLALDDAPRSPTFLRIARAVAEDIRRGRLRAGEPLPGSRSLADTLGVHRNTVLAAYRELAADGWIVSEEARGTWVSARSSSRDAMGTGGTAEPEPGLRPARPPAPSRAPR